ncbi:amino acid adenylation domain protein [Clostridium cellulovorans 743B]|uniref:Amino acid adenylation domain protein n=2 Tax=Clostridium cellulovorans TaxID=1493 RepID=D9SQJ6_CLOC7|nr:amino acid adenylation domain protein [Clostridium cellulovorans 743B]
MFNFKTLAEAITYRKDTVDKGILFIKGEKEEFYLSYKDLYVKSLKYLYSLQQEGMNAGDELVFQINDNCEFICVFWACILGGIVPVPVTIGNNHEHKLKLVKILNILNNPFLIADEKSVVSFKKFIEENDIIDFDKMYENKLISLENLDKVDGIGQLHKVDSKDIAFIQFSSGSTGDPKGVILTHDNLLTNIYAIIKGGKIEVSESVLTWMPLTHDMGLIGCHLTPLINGMLQMNMHTSLFIKYPTLWMKKANEHRANILQSPNFGYKYFLSWFKSEIAKDWDLSCVRLIFNGAEPISIELCHEFTEIMAEYNLSRNVIFPVYGLAEACLAVTFPPVEEEIHTIKLVRDSIVLGSKVEITNSDENSVQFVEVGYPVDNCYVKICDEDNNTLEEEFVGVIHIKGNNVTSGYFNNKEATDAVISDDNWLDTGDLGFLRNGRLVVTGRKKDIIFINGQNYYPHDIERVVETIEGVRGGGVAACGVYNKELDKEEICVFVLFKKHLTEFSKLALEIKKYISENMGLEVSNVLPVKKIPKTTSGKVQRYRFKKDYEEGLYSQLVKDLDEVISKVFSERTIEEASTETEKTLVDICKKIFKFEILGVTDSFFDLGINSIKIAELSNKISKEFSVQIPISDMFSCSNIRLLAKYIDEADRNQYVAIDKITEEEEYYQVSSAQKRIFILEDIEQGGLMYNMPGALVLEGSLDIEHLENSFRKLIDRHEALRTSFLFVNDEPRQKIHEEVTFNLNCEQCDEKDIDAIINDFIRPFNLNEAPLMRVKLLKVKEDKYYLLIDMHHIISDGVSVNLLIKDLNKLYNNEELPELKLQYKDFAAWQNKILSVGNVEKQKNYWIDRFSGDIPVLSMSMDYNRPATQSFEGDKIYFDLDEKLSLKLNKVAKDAGSTMYMVLLAAYNVLLSRYSGQEDIIVGSPIAGRTRTELENVMGMFVNTLAMRNAPVSSLSFLEFLEDVKKNTLSAIDNQEYQFEDLVEALNIPRDISRNPLFDTMFTMQNMENTQMNLEGLKVKSYNIDSKAAKFDMSLDAIEKDDKILFELEYCTALFKKETIEALKNHFINILTSVSEEPNVKLAEIDMLSDIEKQLIVDKFNSKKCQYDFRKTLHELFEENAKNNPTKTAVIYEDSKISYEELNKKSNRIANYLISQGISNENLVGVLMERTPLMVEAILGIWKSNNAYIPLDSKHPVERKIGVLKDSDAEAIITLSEFIDEEFKKEYKGKIVVLDLIEEEILNQSIDNPGLNSDIDSLAYVLFTSGSTGKPKGVMIEHKGMLNHIFAERDELNLDSNMVFAQNASHCFDISVWQFFAALALGGTTAIYSNELILEPTKFTKQIINNKVTLLEVVPSYLMTIMDAVEEDSTLTLEDLKWLMITGEAVKNSVVKRWFTLKPNIKMINAYGPAEASDDITQYIIDEFPENLENIPIGTPLNNVNLYIADKDMNLCPVGVVGEICVSGICVGRGYINNPEKTAEVFLDDPFINGENVRLYRTGDLGKWIPDGSIEFIGRRDYQVKVRGFRIELGEIENVFAGYKGVRDVVAVTKNDHRGNNFICAYYSTDEEVEVQEIKEYLSRYIPEYMIPAYFMEMEQLPLLSNAKVDRKSLPDPTFERTEEYVLPSNEVEEKLLEIWKEILKLDRISVTDNFFSIGGHSLRAANLSARISREINVKIPTKDIFIYPTIKELAVQIEKSQPDNYKAIELIEESEYYELSSAQKRLYVLDSFEENSTMYNMPGVMVVEGSLDKIQLENAFKKIIERHETLRSSFHYLENEPYQKVYETVEFSLSYDEKDEEEIYALAKEFIKPFDLTKAPLLRAGIVKVEEAKHYLFFDMHHIVSDGISIDVLTSELSDIYNGIEPSPIKVQYKDFASWQNDILKSEEMKIHEEYWLNKFSGEIPILAMPTDYTRPSVQSFEGNRIFFEANSELTTKLKKLVKETDTTLYMVLLSAYNVLLSKYTGQDDIVVGSPSAGREKVELENMIGMFVNTLALRNIQKPTMTFKEFLLNVKEDSLKAYESQSYQFEELVEKLNIPRDISRNPIFDTMFTMQNTENLEIAMGGLTFKPYRIDFNVSKFDLSLDAVENKGKIEFEMEYCTALFKKETIDRISDHFINILSSIVENPNAKLSEITLLTEKEKKQILCDFNGKKVPYDFSKTLHQLFEDNAVKTPDKTAIIFGDENISYDALNKKSNSFARYLIEKNVKLETIVGVMLHRSPRFVESVLAIWKAGGAYIPLDVEYPSQRKLSIVEDGNADYIITLSEYIDDEFRSQYKGEIICLDLIEEELKDKDSSNVNTKVDINNLAYILFTSGSTGKPKGVMIEHLGMLNHIFAERDELQLDENLVFAQNANHCFDISVWQFFAALALGGTTAIYPNELILEVDKFTEKIVRDKVTLLEVVPSYLIVMMDYIESNKLTLDQLKYLMITGEAAKPNVIKRWFELFKDKKMVNAYGPAEASDDITQYIIDAETNTDIVSIGKPLSNINIYIMNKEMELCPVGVAGEICVSGICVGRGYINNPEKTEESFVYDPLQTDEKVRMYKTGDIGKWLPDGNIEFIGRSDFQVKVRGFRIELGEIESRIAEFNDVKDAVAVVKKDSKGNNYICAYFAADVDINEEELKEYLGNFVPSYMIPSYFVQLEELPLSPNGKIDRKALPEPEIDENREYVPPRNEIEELLVDIWQQTLGVDRIGINDNFFSLGGDSIKAIKVSSTLGNNGYKLEVRNLFQYPVISKLSAYVKSNTVEAFQGIVEGEVNLTPIQEGFFKHNFTDKHHYNQSVMLFCKDGLKEEYFEEVFDKLIEHHDALRMSYKVNEGAISQINKGIEPKAYGFLVKDLTNADNYKEIIQEEANKLQGSVDLENGPLVQGCLFKTSIGDYLSIVIHHLVVDGVSWRIILEDLENAYSSLCEGLEIQLPKKTSSYKEWSGKLVEYSQSTELLKELEYWTVVENSEAVNLPQTSKIDVDKNKDTALLSVSLDEEATKNLLTECNTAYNTDINDLLLSALGISMKKWTGSDEILINLEGHGREELFKDIDITRTVGWFTAEYPVLIDMAKAEDISFTLKNTKETLRRVPNKGIGYGILKHLSEEAQENFKSSKKPQISFNYLGDFGEEASGKHFGIADINSGSDVSPELEREYVLDINGIILENKLMLKIEFNKKQFTEDSIEKLLSNYIEVLKAIIAHCMGKEETEITPDDVGYSDMSLEQFDDLVDELSDLLGDLDL